MTHVTDEEEPIIISEEDARGGEVTKRGNFGDTLVPMLIGVVALSIVGMGVVALITSGSGS